MSLDYGMDVFVFPKTHLWSQSRQIAQVQMPFGLMNERLFYIS